MKQILLLTLERPAYQAYFLLCWLWDLITESWFSAASLNQEELKKEVETEGEERERLINSGVFQDPDALNHWFRKRFGFDSDPEPNEIEPEPKEDLGEESFTQNKQNPIFSSPNSYVPG